MAVGCRARAARVMGREQFVVLGDAVLFNYRQQIGVMALRNRLPAASNLREFVEAGLLLTYGEDVPVANQIRTYWWCSPPRIGRQRMSPASSTAREIGASFSKDKCVRISL
jgi:hypothetical protein